VKEKMSAITTRINSKEVHCMLRYMLVGAISTLLDLSVLSVLKWMGISTLPANTFSYLAGSIHTFYWNRRWTFTDACGKAWGRQFLSFFAINLIGLFLSSSLTLAFETSIGGGNAGWSFLPAKLMATCVVMIWNYGANRFWTFGMQNKRTPLEEHEWNKY
jgi:putative flippase GtrA